MPEKSKYSRQLALQKFGNDAQDRLRASTVALCGLGGVAAAALPLLAGAGFGKIKIMDGDKVSLHNLHRQSLYTEADEGKQKVECATLYAQNLNSETNIESFNTFAQTPSDLDDFLDGADICIDATDSFKSRSLVSECCKAKKIPLIFAAAAEYVSQVAFFKDDFYFSELMGGDSFKNAAPENLPIFPPAAHHSGIVAASQAILYAAKIQKNFPAQFMLIANFAGMVPEFKKFQILL